MATYRGIKGFTMQSLASDPAANTNTEGQVWYNTTTNVLKGITGVTGVGSWASASNINTPRQETFGTGPGTAGMIVNGSTSSNDADQVYVCEVFDGTSWAETGDTTQRRQDGASAGVATSALVTAGYTTSPRGNSPFTETFNGSTWTEETNIVNGIQGRRGLGATEDASLIVSATSSNYCELWNGSSWSELNDQLTARSGQGTFGTSTA